MEEGYFSLYRKIFKSECWKEPRPKTRFEAWVYIVGMAAYKDTQREYNKSLVDLKCGELITSERDLANALNWKRTRLKNYLKQIESRGQIEIIPTAAGTIIFLVNYADMQNKRTSEKTSKETSEKTSKETSEKTSDLSSKTADFDEKETSEKTSKETSKRATEKTTAPNNIGRALNNINNNKKTKAKKERTFFGFSFGN